VEDAKTEREFITKAISTMGNDKPTKKKQSGSELGQLRKNGCPPSRGSRWGGGTKFFGTGWEEPILRTETGGGDGASVLWDVNGCWQRVVGWGAGVVSFKWGGYGGGILMRIPN